MKLARFIAQQKEAMNAEIAKKDSVISNQAATIANYEKSNNTIIERMFSMFERYFNGNGMSRSIPQTSFYGPYPAPHTPPPFQWPGANEKNTPTPTLVHNYYTLPQHYTTRIW